MSEKIENRDDEKAPVPVEESAPHLDPNRLPPWMLDTAKEQSPDALGWLVAGYLAGVDVGRKSGPCPATPPLYVNGFDMGGCELAYGHPGPHVVHAEYRWQDPESSAGGS